MWYAAMRQLLGDVVSSRSHMRARYRFETAPYHIVTFVIKTQRA